MAARRGICNPAPPTACSTTCTSSTRRPAGPSAPAARSCASPAAATPPRRSQPINDAQLVAGSDSLHLDLNAVFSDADGDALTYAASSSDDAVASATLSGSLLTVRPLTVGNATITVTAEDGRGGRAETAFTVSVPTGVAVERLGDEVPQAYGLAQNYPNPFRASTAIRFEVPQAGRVQVAVFDVLGRRVATLVEGEWLPGRYVVEWAAASMPSGVYVCRMGAGGYVETKPMVLIR